MKNEGIKEWTLSLKIFGIKCLILLARSVRIASLSYGFMKPERLESIKLAHRARLVAQNLSGCFLNTGTRITRISVIRVIRVPILPCSGLYFIILFPTFTWRQSYQKLIGQAVIGDLPGIPVEQKSGIQFLSHHTQ